MSAEFAHYRVVLDLGQLPGPDAARLKAAVIERCANDAGGPAVVVDIMAAEYTWSSVSGCPVCGSLVCAGSQAHREPAPEAGEVGLQVDLGQVAFRDGDAVRGVTPWSPDGGNHPDAK